MSLPSTVIVAFQWPPLNSPDAQWYETTLGVIKPFQDDANGNRRTHEEVLALMRAAKIKETRVGHIIHLG